MGYLSIPRSSWLKLKRVYLNTNERQSGDIIIDLYRPCRFLMLMSSGLYKSLEEATGTHKVNREITELVVEQVRIFDRGKLFAGVKV